MSYGKPSLTRRVRIARDKGPKLRRMGPIVPSRTYAREDTGFGQKSLPLRTRNGPVNFSDKTGWHAQNAIYKNQIAASGAAGTALMTGVATVLDPSINRLNPTAVAPTPAINQVAGKCEPSSTK